MRRCLVVLLVLFAGMVHAATSVSDDNGKRFSCVNPAKRIISLSPDITEILYSIGASEQIVGVIDGSDYPVAATLLPRVGSYQGLDLERIVSRHPDLIVSWAGNFSRQLAVLSNMGVPVYTTNPHELDDVPANIRKLGCLTGHEKQAAEVASTYQRKLNELDKKYKSASTVSVFYQIGSYSLMTINHDSWINQAIRVCGGRNVFADAKVAAPEISWEAAVLANPEVIIADSPGSAGWRQRWQRWPNVAAVKHAQLYSVHADWLDRAGPRLIQGVEEVCRILSHARHQRVPPVDVSKKA